MSYQSDLNWIDASTFQSQLEKLAITLTNKVEREGILKVPSPNYAVTDIGVILRQAVYTYDLLYFLNSDEIKANSGWRQAYTFVALPLIRSMIDCLYNVTSILNAPLENAVLFRLSGYNRLLINLDEDAAMYGGISKWDFHIEHERNKISLDMRSVGFTEAKVRSEGKLWPTLSGYLRQSKAKPLTKHQAFLKRLTFGFWAEYSAVSHATFQGLKLIAPFLLKDRTPQAERDALSDYGDVVMAQHLFRAASILLCLITELQVHFRFDGASIVERMNYLWSTLSKVAEVKELYDGRYKQLLADAGMLG